MLKLAILPGLCIVMAGLLGCDKSLPTQLSIASPSPNANPAAPKANVGGQPPQADALLAAAIGALDSRESLSARLHLSLNFYGQQMVGSGIYLEQAPQRHLRLEMNIQMRDYPASLLQVCDGPILWTFRKQGDEQSLTQVHVARVLAAAGAPAGTLTPAALPAWPGIGGLARLVRALRAAFQFELAEPGQLAQVPVWRVQGRWRPERLAPLLPEQKAAIDQGKEIDFAKLPGQLPSHAVVFLGQEDLIPYRIEYRRTREGRSLGDLESRATVVLALQLSEVSVNVPLDPACFIYQVTTVGSSDATDEYLISAGLK